MPAHAPTRAAAPSACRAAPLRLTCVALKWTTIAMVAALTLIVGSVVVAQATDRIAPVSTGSIGSPIQRQAHEPAERRQPADPSRLSPARTASPSGVRPGTSLASS